jgi:medium-chain acyl-[acyl-carrier-protein] hydrolase
MVTDPSKWILRPRPTPAASLRVFLFPYAGLGPSVFRSWVAEFPPHVEVCLVQPPGREGRWAEQPFVSVAAMAEAATDALIPHLATPFVFFGHSLGALVSFEITRRLRRRNAPLPLKLIASAHRAPQLPNPHPPLRQLNDQDFIDQICRQYGGISQAVLDHPDLIALMLPCLRADFTAFETYRYEPEEQLACPISAFGGTTDGRVSPDEVAAWREQTSDSFTMQMLDGGHFFLQNRRDELLSAIRQELGALGAASIGR